MGMMVFIKFAYFLPIRCYSSLPPSVRVRFAPSPTGFIHLGGLRTAFYNYLYARKNNGKFILRIEDTDQKRIKPGSIENLHAMLNWTGLVPDEGPEISGNYGPYVQSQRLDKYKEKVEYLLSTGAAYRCFCSENRLNIMRRDAQQTRAYRGYDNKCRYLEQSDIEELLEKKTPHTIRFKILDGPVTHEDVVFGTQTYNLADNEGDFVIMKSDGFPTYHLSCVVDDHLMQISHILRGTEWLISTAKHILLHRAFGWSPPQFAHIPLLLNSDKSKLSKRQEAMGIENFKNAGYSPEALLNFLAVAGGGFGRQDGCHVCNLDTLIEKFNLHEVNTNSCIVDFRKLDLFNHDHLLKRLSSDDTIADLITELRVVLRQKYGKRYENEEKHLNDSYIRKILLCHKDRMHTLANLVDPDFEYLWTSHDPKDIVQKLTAMKIKDSAFSGLRSVYNLLSTIPDPEFVESNLGPTLRDISKSLGLSYVTLMLTLRIVLTCQKNGPPVPEILAMLGRKRSSDKIFAILEEINEKEIGSCHSK